MEQRQRTEVRLFATFCAAAWLLTPVRGHAADSPAELRPGGQQVATAPATAPQSDALKNIRSKDPSDRQGAALDLAGDASPKAEAALVKAARSDEDLLGVLTAIRGLEGRLVNKAITKGMVEVALESPFTEARISAARLLGGCTDGSAAAALLKKCSGKTFFVAAAALACCVEASATAPGMEAKAAAKMKRLRAKTLEQVSEARCI